MPSSFTMDDLWELLKGVTWAGVLAIIWMLAGHVWAGTLLGVLVAAWTMIAILYILSW